MEIGSAPLPPPVADDPKTRREEGVEEGMKLFGDSTGMLPRYNSRQIIVVAGFAEMHRRNGRLGAPPPIELVDYPDLFERAWGWDFLLPHDMVTPLAVYKLYLRQYYNRNHHNAAVANDLSLDGDDHGNGLLAALVDKCIKTEDNLKHTWKDRPPSFTTDEEDDEIQIPLVSNEITKHAREMSQVRGSESLAAIALECIIKEAELMRQCILSGYSVMSFAVSNAVRQCALTFMTSEGYDYVSAAAAMMGIMKETELMIGFVRGDRFKNNASIGSVDCFRNRTVLIMLQLCDECYVFAEPTVGNITGDLNSNESDDELADNGNHEKRGNISENKDESDEKYSEEKITLNGMDGGNRTNGNQNPNENLGRNSVEKGEVKPDTKVESLKPDTKAHTEKQVDPLGSSNGSYTDGNNSKEEPSGIDTSDEIQNPNENLGRNSMEKVEVKPDAKAHTEKQVDPLGSSNGSYTDGNNSKGESAGNDTPDKTQDPNENLGRNSLEEDEVKLDTKSEQVKNPNEEHERSNLENGKLKKARTEKQVDPLGSSNEGYSSTSKDNKKVDISKTDEKNSKKELTRNDMDETDENLNPNENLGRNSLEKGEVKADTKARTGKQVDRVRSINEGYSSTSKDKLKDVLKMPSSPLFGIAVGHKKWISGCFNSANQGNANGTAEMHANE